MEIEIVNATPWYNKEIACKTEAFEIHSWYNGEYVEITDGNNTISFNAEQFERFVEYVSKFPRKN